MKSKRGKRNSPESVRRIGRNLCFAGWGLFALSMFLPALPPVFSDGPFYGWHCAWIVLLMLWPGNWNGAVGESLYWASFGLTNLLLFTSPLLMRKSLTGGKLSWMVPILLAIATLDVFSLARSGDGLIGFYTWIFSYALVTSGSFCLLTAQKRQSTPTETPTAPRPRTTEELAAERELENYLRTV